MSSIVFGGTVSMLTVATPSSGWLIGYDTDGILKQKDQFGIIKAIKEVIAGPIGPTGATGIGFNTISNWGNNKIITSTGTNSAYAHDNLTFNGYELSISGCTISSNNLLVSIKAYFNRLSVVGFGMGAQPGKVLSAYDTNGEVSWKTLQELNPYGLTGSTNLFGPNLYSIPMFSGGGYGGHRLVDSPLSYYQQGYVWSNATFSTPYIVVDRLKIDQYNSQNGYYLKSDSSGNATWSPLPGGLTGSGVNNFIPRWTGSNILSSTSSIWDNGDSIRIGFTSSSSPTYKMQVKGDVFISSTSSDGVTNFYNNYNFGKYNNTYISNSWYDTSTLQGRYGDIWIDLDGSYYTPSTGMSFQSENGLSYLHIKGHEINLTLNLGSTVSQFILNQDGMSYYSDNSLFFVSGSTNSVGIGTNTPDNSSILDLSSTTKGFLPPRMTATEAELISSPAEGLMIYSTDGSGSNITSKGWWGWNGTTWEKLN